MLLHLKVLVPLFLATLAGLRRIFFVIGILALMVIVIAYSFEVVARYVFNAPTWWSAELVSYLLSVMVFCVLPQVTATRGHVAVTVLLERLQEPSRKVVERAIFVLGFAACAAITWFAAEETMRQIVRNVQMMAAYPIPKWWVSSWTVMGFGLASLEFLRLAFTAQPKHISSELI